MGLTNLGKEFKFEIIVRGRKLLSVALATELSDQPGSFNTFAEPLA
jgi:hypothetical protein